MGAPKRVYAKGCIRDAEDDRDIMYSAHRKVLTKLETPSKSDILIPHIARTRDQMSIGVCTGAGTANALKTRMNYLGYPFPFNPSALGIYAMARKLEGTPLTEDTGAQIRDVFKVLSTQGVIPEDSNPDWSWPFSVSDERWTQDPSPLCYQHAADHKLVKYMRLKHDINEIKSALAQGMPIVAGIAIYESFEGEKVAKTGFVPMPRSSERLDGYHCIWFFGYNNAKQGYVDGQNSWGRSIENPHSVPWGSSINGQSGFFHIPENFLLNRQLTTDLWAVDLLQ